MTVFKTVLKIFNKNKMIVILYTVILSLFTATNMQTSDNSTNFIASKPDVMIINNDSNNKITNNLINYIKENSNIKKIKNNEEAINDGLFYRDVNYVIYIPKNYRNDFLNGLNPEIEIKSTGDYQASLAELTLTKYIKVSNLYNKNIKDEDLVIQKINETLDKESNITVTSKLDTTSLNEMAFYYNFASYSILACLIYVLCIIISSFKDEKIKKRILISSMDYKKFNRQLLISNFLFSGLLWIIYVLISFIILKESVFTLRGIIYILNLLLFTMCSTVIAFLVSSFIRNKDTINGVVNVITLGSSFLCGVFVPLEWLPNSVITIAHFLPSYWYIKSNELLKSIEVINIETLKPVFINMGVLILFSLLFIYITNFISNKNRKIN